MYCTDAPRTAAATVASTVPTLAGDGVDQFDGLVGAAQTRICRFVELTDALERTHRVAKLQQRCATDAGTAHQPSQRQPCEPELARAEHTIRSLLSKLVFGTGTAVSACSGGSGGIFGAT